MRILFKYTTRSRPTLFARGMRSIIENCVSDNYHILVSIDTDDETMDRNFDYPNTTIKAGESKNKIDAINRDMELAGKWDILVNMSDDMAFTKKGFDDIIRAAFVEEKAGDNSWVNMDRCLHIPDSNRNDLITMAIMGRAYYDRFNYIYHPDYKSLWCDNEMTDVAKKLGCYKFVDEQIVEHRHPAYLKWNLKPDPQYVKTESFMAEDEATYRRRKEINFNL